MHWHVGSLPLAPPGGRQALKSPQGQVLSFTWLYFLIQCPGKGFRSDQIRSVVQSCPTLCDPRNRSPPGLPVHHHLPEFTETHVHPVSDGEGLVGSETRLNCEPVVYTSDHHEVAVKSGGFLLFSAAFPVLPLVLRSKNIIHASFLCFRFPPLDFPL